MKKLALVVMWLAASTTAIGVAWAGVSVVDDQAVDPPSAVEFAPDGRNVTPSTRDATRSDAPATTTVSPANSADTGSIDVAPTIAPATVATTPAPAATSNLAPGPTQSETVAPPPTIRPPTVPPVTAPPAALPPPPTAPSPTVRTYNLIGGTTAISFSSTSVEVLWATPNPGFEVDIDAESTTVYVEFEADNHRSEVEAWWSNGPQRDISEESDD